MDLVKVMNLQRNSLKTKLYAHQQCVNESAGEAIVDVACRTQRNGGGIHAFLHLNTLQNEVLQKEYRMKSVAKPC